MMHHRFFKAQLFDAATFVASYPEQAQRYQISADSERQVLYVPPGYTVTWHETKEVMPDCIIIVADTASLVMHESFSCYRRVVRYCIVAAGGSLLYNSMHTTALSLAVTVVVYERAQASVTCSGTVSGDGQAKLSFIQEHKAPESVSDVVIRQALYNQASVFMSGTVIIPKHAARARARQESKGLLLGQSVRFSGEPSLKVANRTAVCMHGCAAGPLDSSQLVYVQARGLSKKQAQLLLVEGFLQAPFKRKGIV